MNILDELVAKGVAGDVIVAVAKLIVDAEQTERIRAAARERMRVVRERSRTHANSSEQKSTNIEERKIEKEGSKVVRASRAKPKIPLPDNWHPELAGDIEFEKFCDHARQNDRRCADWEAARRNWNRNAPKFNGGQGNGRGQPAPKDDPKSIRGAFDRLFASLDGCDETSEPSRQANLRVIPGGSG